MLNNTFRKNGQAIYLVGKSRSGKTATAQHLIRNGNYKRVLAWDYDGGWSTIFHLLGLQFEIITGATELTQRLKNDRAAGLICYKPESFSKNISKEFDFFCGAAFLWIKQEPAAVIVEEAASVLTSGRASGYWKNLQNQGQKYGGTVICIIQAAQDGDKNTLTQATDKFIFMVEDHDRKYIQEKFGLSIEQVPTVALAFVHINAKGEKRKGYLDFNGQPEKGADPKFFKLKYA